MRWAVPYFIASNQKSNSGRLVVGGGVSCEIGSVVASCGMVYPAANGNTLGSAAKQGSSEGSLITILILSGPAGSAAVPIGGGGPSSSRGFVWDVGKSRVSVAMVLGVTTETTLPRASRRRMVTGHMSSNESPRLPAMTASPFSSWVGNGHERMVSFKLGWMKHNCLTSPLLHTLAVRARELHALDMAFAMYPAWVGSGV